MMTLNSMSNGQKRIIEQLIATFPDRSQFRTAEVVDAAKSIGVRPAEAYKITTTFPKVKRGICNLEAAIIPFRADTNNQPKSVEQMKPSVQSVSNEEVFVPAKDEYFVAWGNFKDITTILESKMFYPVYITGLSGNGKTTMVEQACAKLNRQYVRVQITPETDEDDLLGGFRLVNGETVFAKGPVVKAMESGAVLLVDEIDRGSNKIMCLQGVLEGKPVMIKKTGEIVTPAKGFTIVSTANTKGKGSDDGRFVAASIIDEAFLERFNVTIEQPYPTPSIEKRIINKHMEKFSCEDSEFSELLTQWSDTIRKTFEDGGLDELVSTRRLCHIVQTFSIFKDRKKAVELCVNRFDEDTKEAFIDLYTKVDASIGATESTEETNKVLVDAELDAILEEAKNT